MRRWIRDEDLLGIDALEPKMKEHSGASSKFSPRKQKKIDMCDMHTLHLALWRSSGCAVYPDGWEADASHPQVCVCARLCMCV